MVAAGSAGHTLEHVLSFVGSKSLDHLNSRFSYTMSNILTSNSGGPKISFANGVWVDKRYPLKPSYQQCARDVFKSKAEIVDFTQAREVVNEINSWAKFPTNGLIQSLV
ncbi:hypothetical protein ACH5RR_018892 [Cinchona calisaya]|uniref:Serpin domain-containing protein n=1 Tax=Cinchona calisaya TaxID=153742 RepID=A0ABD2ZSX4_9GENT